MAKPRKSTTNGKPAKPAAKAGASTGAKIGAMPRGARSRSAARSGTATRRTARDVRATDEAAVVDGRAVEPRTAERAAHESADAERAADPELRELGDEAIDRLDDPRDTDDDLLATVRDVLDAPDGADAARAPDEEASPELAGGDVDAAATETGSGEEAVGGSNPTPDQDNVEEQGEALGVTYQPDEPLHTTEKIARRDDDRWELNPASSEDFAERRNFAQAAPERPPRRRR